MFDIVLFFVKFCYSVLNLEVIYLDKLVWKLYYCRERKKIEFILILCNVLN